MLLKLDIVENLNEDVCPKEGGRGRGGREEGGIGDPKEVGNGEGVDF